MLDAEGRNEEEISERLKPLVDMVEAVESSLTEATDDEYVQLPKSWTV